MFLFIILAISCSNTSDDTLILRFPFEFSKGELSKGHTVVESSFHSNKRSRIIRNYEKIEVDKKIIHGPFKVEFYQVESLDKLGKFEFSALTLSIDSIHLFHKLYKTIDLLFNSSSEEFEIKELPVLSFKKDTLLNRYLDVTDISDKKKQKVLLISYKTKMLFVFDFSTLKVEIKKFLM